MDPPSQTAEPNSVAPPRSQAADADDAAIPRAGRQPAAATRGERLNQRSTWSVIVCAQGEGPTARGALEELFRRYDRAVLTKIRAIGHPWNQSAEDLKQEFFEQLVRNGDVHKLDRGRGSFRAWLSTAVANFMKNRWAHWLAIKRGNGLTQPRAFQQRHETTPEHLFMRQFAVDTLLHALALQRAREPDKARFDRWARMLPGPQLDLSGRDALAYEFGMTRGHAAVYVCRLRKQHQEALRAVVADTLDVDLADPEGAREVARELGALYRVLCEAPPGRAILEDA